MIFFFLYDLPYAVIRGGKAQFAQDEYEGEIFNFQSDLSAMRAATWQNTNPHSLSLRTSVLKYAPGGAVQRRCFMVIFMVIFIRWPALATGFSRAWALYACSMTNTPPATPLAPQPTSVVQAGVIVVWVGGPS